MHIFCFNMGDNMLFFCNIRGKYGYQTAFMQVSARQVVWHLGIAAGFWIRLIAANKSGMLWFSAENRKD